MQTFRTSLMIFIATLMSLQLFAQQNNNSSVKPLLVVDGVVIRGDVPRPDPIWVTNVDVVKGEEATNAYGAEGANGVVKITMKYDVPPVFSSDTKKRMTPFIHSKIEWKAEYDKIKFRFSVGIDGKMKILNVVDSSNDELEAQVRRVISELPNWESPAMDNGEVVVAKGVMILRNPAQQKKAIIK